MRTDVEGPHRTKVRHRGFALALLCACACACAGSRQETTVPQETRSPSPNDEALRTGDEPVEATQYSLDPEVIRRVIQQNIGAVRGCYERMLVRQMGTGRVVVRFMIGPEGRVEESITTATTLDDTETEQCIADAVHGLTFPPPEGGGFVVVTYPFVLDTNPEDTPSRE